MAKLGTTDREYEKLHLHAEFPYTKNIKADPRGLGFPAYLCPHPYHTSASRLGMLSKHLHQALPIKGSDFIQTFTGWEQDLKDYTFDTTKRKDDGQILAVIPKYDLRYSLGMSENKTPYYTVIYRRDKDNVIDYFNLERYQNLSDSWGYPNVWNENINSLLTEGQYLSKDTVLSHSPNIKNGLYSVGTNANVAYLSMPFTKEDGMGVSESLAERLCSWGLQECLANIRYDYIPINLYGDKDNPKFFPNIGEKIRDDGIICAFRSVTQERFAGDAAPEALSEVDPSTDITFNGPAGGIIADVEFIVNRQKRMQAFPQVRVYQDALKKYYEDILTLHNKFQRSNSFSPKMETLVTEAIKALCRLGSDLPGIKLPAATQVKDPKNQIVDFIQARFTCFTEVPFRDGSKLSDLQGGKGTCAVIIPDDEMPVDAYGNRADLIMEPPSPVKRTNFGALWEPTETYILNHVLRIARESYDKGDKDKAFEIINEVCRDFHPSYADLMLEVFPSQKEKHQFVDETMKVGKIFLHVPPGLETINTQTIAGRYEDPETGLTPDEWWNDPLNEGKDEPKWKKVKEGLVDKWGIELSPVSFVWEDTQGKKKTYTTSTPCMIGSKCVIRLCKEAVGMSAGIASVSHYGTPTRPHMSKKYSSILRQTPVRFGEDETNIMTMAGNVDEVLRHQRLTSKSPLGTEVMVETIMDAEQPTNIKRIPISDEDLAQNDTISRQFHHITGVGGTDTFDTALSPSEVQAIEDLPKEIVPQRIKRKRKKRTKE